MDTIFIHSTALDPLIGRGGANIRQLQQEYNVRISIDKKKIPIEHAAAKMYGVCRHKVTVEGAEDDIKKAIAKIRNIDEISCKLKQK
jgi:KH domain